MKRISHFAYAIAIALSGCMQAGRVTNLEVPLATETHVAPIDVTPYLDKYAQYEGVYLEYESIVEHSGDKEGTKRQFLGILAPPDWTYSYIHRSKMIVIDPEAAWLTTIEFPYSKPDKLFMRVIAPDGSVKSFGPEDLVKSKAGGTKNYEFIYPNIQRGTIIETGYEYSFSVLNHLPSLDEEFPLQLRVPCEKLDVKFAYPDWWLVAIKQIGKNKPVYVESIRDEAHNKSIIAFHGTNVPAWHPEPFSPYFKEAVMYLSLQVTSLQMRSATWDNPRSWGELSERFRKNTLKKSDKRSELMEQIVDSLTMECTTLRQRVEVIHDYLTTTITADDVDFDGNPDRILKEKKGNAYEITSLEEQMLREVGIVGSYILIHSAMEGYFDVNFISGTQLSLPALHVDYDSVDYVLLPYIERIPANLVPEYVQGQPAMMASEGSGNALWTVPVTDRTDNAETRTCEIFIDTSGTVSAREVQVFRGSYAYSMREGIRNYTENELRDTLQAMVSFEGGDAVLDSFSILSAEDYKVPLEITVYYRVGNILTFAENDAILQSAGLLAPTTHEIFGADSTERTNPIAIYYDRDIQRQLTVSYPAEWDIVTKLENVSYSNQFGSISGSYQHERGKLTVDQVLSLNRSSSPKEEYGELLALVGTTPKTWVPSIVFRRGPAN